MRLLFVSHSLPPLGRPMENIGGMQRVATDLHDSLLEHRAISVRSLVLRSAWKERAYRTPIFLGMALREIRRMARAREIDAVLFSSMVTAAVTVPLANVIRRNGIVTASIANGLDATTATWPYPAVVRRTFKALDVVMPISHATANACSLRGMPTEKCRVVPLGIRLDRFRPAGDKADARDNLSKLIGSPAAHPGLVLCSVGRLVPRKGIAWFVATVMPALPEDVRLLIVGDGPEKLGIETAIAANRLGARVKLLGMVSDTQLETVYLGSDLFVMPNVPVQNDMEGFGLVMLEAGLCSLPVIASNIEGIADVITDGENGHLVPARDAGAFIDAIMRYHADPASLRAASARARLHTVSRFAWSGVVERYTQIIAEVRTNQVRVRS